MIPVFMRRKIRAIQCHQVTHEAGDSIKYLHRAITHASSKRG